MKIYQIGEFAKNLGVSTQHIKHYSKFKLLSPIFHENGYRFYSFREASRVVNFVRLRAYGYGIKETEKIMKADSFDAVSRLIQCQRGNLKDEIRRKERMLSLLDEVEDVYDKAIHHVWEVKELPPLYVHQNAMIDGFLETERIQRTTKKLTEYYPFVYSCAVLSYERETEKFRTDGWGLCLAQRDVDDFAIDVSGCRKLFGKKTFIHYCYCYAEYGKMRMVDMLADVLPILREQRLSISGEIIFQTYLHSNYKDHNILLYKAMIPVRDQDS